MARLTNTTNNIPILNQALVDIAQLKAQVGALVAPPALKIYTPNVFGTTGTFTTVQAQGWYQLVGIQVLLILQVKIVAVGTGTGPNVSLPLAATSKLEQVLVGREDATTGNEYQFRIQPGKNYGTILRYDNSAAVSSGYVYNISGMYLIDP